MVRLLFLNTDRTGIVSLFLLYKEKRMEVYYFNDDRAFHALLDMDFCSQEYIRSMLLLMMLNGVVIQLS